jgi:TonB-dependent siderophore receptor
MATGAGFRRAPVIPDGTEAVRENVSMNRKAPLTATLLALCAGLAQAAEPARHFEISAQPLSGALRAFADLTGEQVVFFSEIGRDQLSAEVVGHYTPEQALGRLLHNTGLTFERLDTRTIAITSSTIPLSAVNGARGGDLPIRLAQVDGSQSAPAAQPGQPEPGDVQEVVVHGARFNYQEIGTALKVPLSIKDTPQTVLAITADVMDFASVKAFQDVYKVDATGGTSHRTDNIAVNYFRGFRQDDSYNALKVDGFRLTGTNLDFAPFERLELVKGSTSTLYGQNSVAGTLNAISKMPQDRFGGEIKAEAGSFDRYRVDADFHGPLTSGGALTYRVVGARLDENSYLDYGGKETTVFAPTLRYQFGADTSVYLRLNYQKSELAPHWGAGLQYLGDVNEGFASGFDPSLLVIPDLPRSHFNGASWNNSEFDNALWQGSLEHRFGNGWMLRANAQHSEQNFLYHDLFAGFLQANGVPLVSFAQRNDNDSQSEGGEVQLFGDVELFGRTHTLFFGADYFDISNPLVYSTSDAAPPSVFDPTFNTAVPPVAGLDDYNFFFGRRLSQRNSGVTAQMFLRPAEGLTLHVGGRYSEDKNTDRIRIAGSNDLFEGAEETTALLNTHAFTLQTGLTYAITPQLNVYASYGETYDPQSGLVDESTFIDPEDGVAKEIGLKGAHGQRFSYSLALFDMERDNIAESRPGTPFVDPVGTQRSRGIEAEFQGTVRPGWELFASVGRMDAEFVDGDLAGYRPGGAPKFGLSMFTSYEIQGGALRGVGIGGGVVHKSGRETFLTPAGLDGLPIVFDFGDYTEVDLRLFRNLEKWRLQVSATNLLDEKYYSPAPYNNFGSGIHVNPGRTIIGQAIYRF